MEKGIIVYWSESQEVIEFDYENLESIGLVRSSSELCDSGDKYNYVIEPQINKLEDGMVEVKIKYKSNVNTDIDPDEVCWGTSTLILKPNEYSGEAHWIDDVDHSHDGVCRWVRLDSPLKSSQRRRVTSTKLQREQAQFRKLLMKLDKCCVLTGEESNTVLEAAHIIPVAGGGPDIPSNGIVLRCDLHRLYDSAAFNFDRYGNVLVNSEACSSYYVKLLTDTKLPRSTLERVQQALVEKEA
ncbi:HNH endonuclease [Photobacterium japonica]|uniref:HNH endonuclease n=1 Tax=Photobacterium japonica TaxID=2910235 RepID=UPI003D1119F7